MAYASGEACTSQYVIDDTSYDEAQQHNIPEGQWVLYSGMHGEATDGKVGKLAELVLYLQSGEVANLLLREGHLWGKKEVTIPMAAAYFYDVDTLYLELDEASARVLPAVPLSAIGTVDVDEVVPKVGKQAIGALPSMPVKRHCD